MSVDTHTRNLFPGLPSYVGRIGERLQRDVRVLAVYENEQDYKRFKVVMIDAGLNRFIWRTNTKPIVKAGDERTVRATVLRHSRKRVETVLSKCRFIVKPAHSAAD